MFVKRLYLKNPRGPITMKQFSNGRYLLLFYNNGDTGKVYVCTVAAHCSRISFDAVPSLLCMLVHFLY